MPPDEASVRMTSYREGVYAPDEDTFLLTDALKNDAGDVLNRASVAVEVGVGSGYVATSAAMNMRKGGYVVATDVNAEAARCALETARNHGVALDVVLTDGLGALRRRLGEGRCVDVLACNPPYVPTEEGERWDAAAPSTEVPDNVRAAYAGGEHGRTLLDPLIPAIAEVLAPSTGRAYVVLLHENGVEGVRERALHDHNLASQVVLERRADMERLCVLRMEAPPA